ncbi:MAG TPA: hypothetical protein VN397_02615 [Candidatus Methylomirabilis sp.]|nr:hypothetical protein [Candidatus Methylomirabilis sp.]
MTRHPDLPYQANTLPEQPPSSLIERINVLDPTKEVLTTKEEYDAAKAFNTSALANYPDGQRLVVLDHLNNEPIVATAGELRRELTWMEDPERGRHHGGTYNFSVLSDDVDAWFATENARIQRNLDRYLEDLAPYAEDQEIWFCHPNEWGSPDDIYHSTAGKQRAFLTAHYDRAYDATLARVGGIRILSTDPSFDPAKFYKENTEGFREMLEGVVEDVNRRGGHALAGEEPMAHHALASKAPSEIVSPYDAAWGKLGEMEYKGPTEKEFKRAREDNLKQLAKYADDEKLVVVFGSHLEPVVATAGELRRELYQMADPEKGRRHGMPYHLFVRSNDPGAYLAEDRAHLEKSRDHQLKKLAPYADEQLLWYAYPNRFHSPNDIHQGTAGSLRQMLAHYDHNMDDHINHGGGINVISTDPAFDPVAYFERNRQLHSEMVQQVVGKVSTGQEIKGELISGLSALDDAASVQILYPKQRPLHMSVKDARTFLSHLSTRDIEEEGVPLVESVDATEPMGPRALPAHDETVD